MDGSSVLSTWGLDLGFLYDLFVIPPLLYFVDLLMYFNFGKGFNPWIVTEPPKSLGPPTVVLVQRTSDNPAGAPDHLTSSVSVFFTLPKSVSPVTQTLQYIGGT
jgi:hypothetical protein